jgi:hypothetical protein
MVVTGQFFSRLLTLVIPGMLGILSATLQKEPLTAKLTEHPIIGYRLTQTAGPKSSLILPRKSLNLPNLACRTVV